MSQPYSKVMAMRTDVSCIPCDTYSKGKTGDIITFSQFEEGNLLSETCDNTESNKESDDKSTLAPLISEEEMDVMSTGYESDDELTTLKDISDGSQSLMIINRIEERYNKCDHIK